MVLGGYHPCHGFHKMDFIIVILAFQEHLITLTVEYSFINLQDSIFHQIFPPVTIICTEIRYIFIQKKNTVHVLYVFHTLLVFFLYLTLLAAH